MNYYFLVSYLPEIHRDDKKLRFRVGDLLAERFHIAREDWHQIELVLLARDIFLVENLLAGRDVEIEHTLHDREFWKEQIRTPREVPPFLEEYFRTMSAEDMGPRGVDRLYEAYYGHAMDRCSSPFLRGYFHLERDLKNVLAATRARKKGLAPSEHVVGEGDVVEQLGRSTAEDFGLGRDMPWIDRILEATDPLELEDQVERTLWEYVDERTGHCHFEFDVVLGYLLKLLLLEKRLALSEEQGMETVRQLEEL